MTFFPRFVRGSRLLPVAAVAWALPLFACGGSSASPGADASPAPGITGEIDGTSFVGRSALAWVNEEGNQTVFVFDKPMTCGELAMTSGAIPDVPSSMYVEAALNGPNATATIQSFVQWSDDGGLGLACPIAQGNIQATSLATDTAGVDGGAAPGTILFQGVACANGKGTLDGTLPYTLCY